MATAGTTTPAAALRSNPAPRPKKNMTRKKSRSGLKLSAMCRAMGEEAMAILHASPLAKHVRNDMRQRTQKVVVEFDQERARWSAVSRFKVAQAAQRVHDGTPVGLYREGDTLLPIIARTNEACR